MESLLPDVFLFRDTCHVYIVRCGDSAVLVDFGDGACLDALPALGIRRVTDILATHHHRDQVQGLHRALGQGLDLLQGVRVWAPHAEQDLFHSVDIYWQARPLLNNYDVRQDRFSLLDPVSLAGTLKDYSVYPFGGRNWQVIPTPGHTPGSISLLVEVNGKKVAFTGDLIAGEGKIWSMSALQWSYCGIDGAAALIPALLDLKARAPDLLLPSHGALMTDASGAIDPLVQRLRRLLDSRRENLRQDEWLSEPYEDITPHLLRNRTSVSNSYVLLSESGKALLIDYGYDFVPSNLMGPDRALHRPWLYTIPALKRQYGVAKIDVVIATHYHDDHVAGFNLLRDVEGARVWAAESIADILVNPQTYDLPCLWYDPIPVDRVLAAGQAIAWEEYSLTVYPLPGHTRYACAVAFEVDGKRVLATGDQYKGNDGLLPNFVYQNRFEIDDFQASAQAYTLVRPDLILPGHWDPLWLAPGYLEDLQAQGELLAELHRELLPLEQANFGGEGFAARIQPYHYSGAAGCAIVYQVEVRNPLAQECDIEARMVLPDGWLTSVPAQTVRFPACATRVLHFRVTPPAALTGRRFRVAVDLTAGEVRLGQQAEALVDLQEKEG